MELLIVLTVAFLLGGAVGSVVGHLTKRDNDELDHFLFDRRGECDWTPRR